MGIQSCAILVTTWVVAWENVQLQYCKIIELSAQYKVLNCSDTSEKVCCRSMSLYHIIVQTVIATRSQKLLHTATSSPSFARMLQLSLHLVHIQLTSSVLLHTWFSVAWHYNYNYCFKIQPPPVGWIFCLVRRSWSLDMQCTQRCHWRLYEI